MDVTGQLHAPAALTPEKCSPYPLHRWLDGFKSRSGDAEKQNPGPATPKPKLLWPPTVASTVINSKHKSFDFLLREEAFTFPTYEKEVTCALVCTSS
jgi:hypothetical protein